MRRSSAPPPSPPPAPSAPRIINGVSMKRTVTLVEMSSAATDTWNAPASSFATSSTLAHWKVVVTYVVCASASAAVCGKVRLRCPVTTLKKSNSGKLCPLTVSFAVTTATVRHSSEKVSVGPTRPIAAKVATSNEGNSAGDGVRH